MPDSFGTPRQRGPNNSRQIETVSRNVKLIENVRDDAEAAALVAGRGYDADALAEGLTRGGAYLGRYGARNTATGDRTHARDALRALDDAAREMVGELRATLRLLYRGQREHLERLGVAEERLAEDRDEFLGESRATLAAVREDPYAAAVATKGYPETALDAVEAAVDALSEAAGDRTSAEGSHTGSTTERDASYQEFMAWMTPARGFFKLALKKHPEGAARVGL